MEDSSGMRPKMGDTSVTLPITFDYSGGRQDTSKSKRMWSIILAVVMLIIAIGTFCGKNPFYIKIPLGIAEIFGTTLFIRFILLKERKKKAAYQSILDADGLLGYPSIWGIYKIDDTFPYVCHFRNGKKGLYIRLNKDVILGKYSESEYNHYEAVADAYNLAGSGHIQMMHIDYMASIGTDERLEESFKMLEDVPNPDLRDLLTDIYSYQQNSMKSRVTTFDVYAFIWTGNSTTAWNQITRILNCFLDANYRSYRVLNQRELRDLVKDVFNLGDFSAVEASMQAFETRVSEDSITSITPISVINVDGSEVKLNKTVEEKERDKRVAEEERIAKEKEIERRKQLAKGAKKGKKSEEDETEVFEDIF